MSYHHNRIFASHDLIDILRILLASGTTTTRSHSSSSYCNGGSDEQPPQLSPFPMMMTTSSSSPVASTTHSCVKTNYQRWLSSTTLSAGFHQQEQHDGNLMRNSERRPPIPLRLDMDDDSRREEISAAKKKTKTRTTTVEELADSLHYDFIVIGNGSAGQSAAQTLRKECPNSTVLVIDPLRTKDSNKKTATPKDDAGVEIDYCSAWATSLDPCNRCVSIEDFQHHDSSSSSSPPPETTPSTNTDENPAGKKNKIVLAKYRYGVILATGSRGATPPQYLMDEAARSHILELRSTVLPHSTQTRPVEQSQEQVRHHVMKASSSGCRVGVLGSGWEAVDLAVGAANASRRRKATARGKKHKQQQRQGPLLVLGGSAPLAHVLPNYLSSAVSKRLRSKKITVHNRTLVRYIGHSQGIPTDTTTTDSNGSNSSSSSEQQHVLKDNDSRLQLYTAKSYDFLDSDMDILDWLVVAPDVSGSRGSAAIPTINIPNHLVESRQGRSFYHHWSQLQQTQQEAEGRSKNHHNYHPIACYKEDGRVVVNAELCACSGVYAAGGVAKYPNGVSGHAAVAGVGVEDAIDAGRIAALNLSQQYYNYYNAQKMNMYGSFSNKTLPEQKVPFTKDPIPVFRTDVLSYSGGQRSSLLSVGINALCVGNCDSGRMQTHGVWWTNLAAGRRILSKFSDADGAHDDDGEIKASSLLRRRTTVRECLKPVYGLGVVYYLDRTYKLQGIMIWGLPFTEGGGSSSSSSSSRGKRKLNRQVVEHMKELLRTNGGLGSVVSEADHIRLSKSLSDHSKHLVWLAYAGYAATAGGGEEGDDKEDGDEIMGRAHRLDGELSTFPRSLYRITPARPPNVRTMGVIKRKDGHAHGVLGEDLFARYETTTGSATIRPEVTAAGSAAAAAAAAADDEPNEKRDGKKDNNNNTNANNAKQGWQQWEQREREWDENEQRARPAKEDPLWIRKGDEMKSTSFKETIMAAYNSAIWSGTGK